MKYLTSYDNWHIYRITPNKLHDNANFVGRKGNKRIYGDSAGQVKRLIIQSEGKS